MTPPTDQPADAQQAKTHSIFGIAERLLAGTAVAGATIYVLINALYIEYYDDFGLRPENVGLDRLAVLARSAWVAVILIAVTAVAVILYSSISEREFIKSHRAVLLGVVIAVAATAVLGGFFLTKKAVEDQARALKGGRNIDGVGIFVNFVDLQSNRARVSWIGDDPAPDIVNKPFLTYMGSNNGAAIFVECGSVTHVVPSDDLVITIVSTEADEVAALDRQIAQFKELCPNSSG